MAKKIYHLTLTEEEHQAWVYLQYTGWKMTQLLGDCKIFDPYLQDVRAGLCKDWWRFTHVLHPVIQALSKKDDTKKKIRKYY